MVDTKNALVIHPDPMEVGDIALHSNQPKQYPIPENKRIQAYKS